MAGHWEGQNWVEDDPNALPQPPGLPPGTNPYGPPGFGLGTNQPTGPTGQYNNMLGQSYGPFSAPTGPGGAAMPGSGYAPSGGTTPRPNLPAGTNPAAGVSPFPTLQNNTTGRGNAQYGVNINPVGNYNDPQLAMMAALQARGISATSNNPFIKDIMSRANDIIQTIQPGLLQQNVMAGTDAAAQAVQAQVDRALHGGQTFFSPTQATGVLDAMKQMTALGSANAGSTDPAMAGVLNFLSMAQDPNASANLLQSIINGGGSPQQRAVLAKSYAAIPGQFSMMLGQNPNAQYGPNGQLMNVLDMILQGLLTPGSQNAPAPSFLPAGYTG